MRIAENISGGLRRKKLISNWRRKSEISYPHSSNFSCYVDSEILLLLCWQLIDFQEKPIRTGRNILLKSQKICCFFYELFGILDSTYC